MINLAGTKAVAVAYVPIGFIQKQQGQISVAGVHENGTTADADLKHVMLQPKGRLRRRPRAKIDKLPLDITLNRRAATKNCSAGNIQNIANKLEGGGFLRAETTISLRNIAPHLQRRKKAVFGNQAGIVFNGCLMDDLGEAVDAGNLIGILLI